MRQPAQAMIEFAVMLPFMLFCWAGLVDLAVGWDRDGRVAFATAYSATQAAAGRPSSEVVQTAVALAQGVLGPADVQVTACLDRLLPGTPATVQTTYRFRPLTPILERFWQVTGRSTTPLVHRVTLPVTVPCVESLL